MLSHISSIEQLRAECEEIQAFLDITTSDQVEEALERGNELSAIISRTGKMKSDAKYHLDEFMRSEIFKVLEKSAQDAMPASVMNKLLDASCKDYNNLFLWCDRLNSTATHQLDWCRTVVSNEKSMREASKGFRQ